MKVLIGCEESQEVTKEFRKLGAEAYSCDIQNCSGGHPEWHLQDDIFNVINDNWDLFICFPPCTHLAVSGAKWFEKKRQDGRQQEAIEFFLKIAAVPIKHKAIENPIGIMSTLYKKPSQIIQPYFFGDEAQKTTCLWLENLPLLYHNNKPNLFDKIVTHTNKGEFIKHKSGKIKPKWFADAFILPPLERQKVRSKTFPGIAKAMAVQWYNYVKNDS